MSDAPDQPLVRCGFPGVWLTRPTFTTNDQRVVVTLVVVLVVALGIALTVGEVVHRHRGPRADKDHGGFRLGRQDAEFDRLLRG